MKAVGGGKGWRIEREGTTVRATFQGLLDEARGRESADALFEVVRELAVVDLVFDVHQMEGYETAARKAWQHVLVPLRTKIRSLRTIGANAIVRMGASTLGLLTGIAVEHS